MRMGSQPQDERVILLELLRAFEATIAEREPVDLALLAKVRELLMEAEAELAD